MAACLLLWQDNGAMLLRMVRCRRLSTYVCYQGVQKNSNGVLTGVECVLLGADGFLDMAQSSKCLFLLMSRILAMHDSGKCSTASG